MSPPLFPSHAQIAEAEACLRACIGTGVISEAQGLAAIAYLESSTSGFVRSICSALLLDLAGRGHDALYERVRRLEDALAGAVRQELPPSLVMGGGA